MLYLSSRSPNINSSGQKLGVKGTRFKNKLFQSIDNDIRKIQGKRVKHFERALLPRVFQYLALYSCCCNANEVLAFLRNSYIQKYKLYLQLHKKIKPKGKGETENLLNLRSLNTRLKHFQLELRKKGIH